MPKKNKSDEKLAWQLIREVLCLKDADKHKRCMAMILRLMPQISQSEWAKRCAQLYRTDSVQGPEAVAWGLRMMAMIHPPGKDRRIILDQMDKAKNDAALMRKIRKGWQEYGYEDCWWVVHDKPERQMARYHSEPVLSQTLQKCLSR